MKRLERIGAFALRGDRHRLSWPRGGELPLPKAYGESIDPARLFAAMRHFDREERQHGNPGWKRRKNERLAILFEGRLYPLRRIVLATGWKHPLTSHQAQFLLSRDDLAGVRVVDMNTHDAPSPTADDARESREPLPLKRVTITGFRGIRSLHMDLDPRLTVLFGENATGKTTILRALAVGLGRILDAVPGAHGPGLARTDIHRPPSLLISLGAEPAVLPYAQIEVESVDSLIWDRAVLRGDNPADAPEGTSWGNTQIGAYMRAAISHIQEGEDRVTLPVVVSFGTERRLTDTPMKDADFLKEPTRFGAFSGALDPHVIRADAFGWFRFMEDEERRDQNRHRDFDRTLLPLDEVREAVKRAATRCTGVRVETKPLRLVVDFARPDGWVETLAVDELSEGYKVWLALVMDIARRLVQANPPRHPGHPLRGIRSRAVILIDEIDLHLHPNRQAEALLGLLDAFPGAQFVVTTHSEQVIAVVEREGVRKLVARNQGIEADAVPFAQGATTGRILAELMGAEAMHDGPVTQKLREYLTWVAAGEGRTEQALARLQELVEALTAEDPMLVRARLDIERQERLAGVAR